MQRPKTSQMVIEEFAKIIDSQDKKGFEKYGVTIDDAKDQDYSWQLMALEETADLQKYLVKRIKELESECACCILDLLDAKEKIRHLKSLSRVSKCMQLEESNLTLAQEVERLKELLRQNGVTM